MDWKEYVENNYEIMHNLEYDHEIISILKNTLKSQNKIFIAGNGGSAAIAQHYLIDIAKCINKTGSISNNRYKVISLVSNQCYLTAISNDANYDVVFSEQLINLAVAKDILILISASGDSPNIIKAAEYAKKIGMVIIGITGFDGGRVIKYSDYNVRVKSHDYGICENIHSIFGHFLSNELHSSG